MPVIYVFGKRPFDPVDCAKKLLDSARVSAPPPEVEIDCGKIDGQKLVRRNVKMMFDVAYVHRACE